MAWPSPVHCGGRNSEMPVAPGAKSHSRVGRDMQNTMAFARQTVNLPGATVDGHGAHHARPRSGRLR